MATVFDVLMKKLDIDPPLPGESGRDFTIRLAEAVSTYKGWEGLPDNVQTWYNNVIHKVDDRAALLDDDDEDVRATAEDVEIPTVEGFVAVPITRASRRADPEDAPPARARSRERPARATARRAEPEPEPEPEPEKETVGDTRIPASTKIILVATKCARRPGSKAYKLFSKYKTGKTIADMMKAGMPRRDINIDRANGVIRFEGYDDEAAKAEAIAEAGVAAEGVDELVEAAGYQEQGETAAVVLTILEGLRDFADKMIKQLGNAD